MLVEKEKEEADRIKHGTFKNQISIIEKKYEINELEIKQKLQESKISVLVVAFLLSIISVFFIYMMYKKKEEHNQALLLVNQEVREANKNVVAAAKAKENFLTTMSHEMCTPMNAVIGITNILLDENPTGKQTEHLKNLKFSGEVLLNIINEVLDFSKISTNKLELFKEPIHIQEFLDRITNSYRQSNSNQNVIIFQDQQLQKLEHLVLLDKTRFSQILTNLIGNAFKFTNVGSIVLRSRIKENTADMVKITFQIEDTGIGIPKEKLESIFESFSQVNNEINREHEGTGLGLTITKNLIELKGGKIEVTSTEGKGSTFTFTLELGKEEKIKKVQEPSASSDKIFQSGIEGKKILLVEDNKLNQLVAKKVLNKFKVEIALAENGLEAVDMVQQDKYDLILMDIHMPLMDGLEATRSIRALEDPFFKQIPIVALSADAYSDKVQATTESGMNDYLAKPFKPEALFQKIKSNIERAGNIRGTA
jgi:signal transduction histidine kinase/ActR/RegA family two-component response regulator